MKFHAAFVAAAMVILGPGGVWATMDDAELRERIKAQSDASILSIDEGRINGESVRLVKVMGGRNAGNSTFRVDVIAVNPETGELLRGRYPELSPAHFLGSTSTRMLDRRPEAFPRVRLEGR